MDSDAGLQAAVCAYMTSEAEHAGVRMKALEARARDWLTEADYEAYPTLGALTDAFVAEQMPPAWSAFERLENSGSDPQVLADEWDELSAQAAD
jgi:hypothetical protein